MDPKKQPTLDPKLKEIYDRVMGTPTPRPAPQSPPSPKQVEEKKEEKPRLFHQNTSSKAFVDKGESSSKKPWGLVFIIIGVLFLITYTLFWLKFFNIPLPFTLPF